MQGVLNDRSTERKSELLVLGGCLDVGICRRELSRRLGAEVIAGIGAENLALEPIGARFGLRSDGHTRDLIVFGLVIGRDDLVFADRKLRKGVALSIVCLATQAASDVTLLAYAVDIYVDRVVVLRPASDRGLAGVIGVEHDSRHRIRELEEVAAELRNRLDVVQRYNL